MQATCKGKTKAGAENGAKHEKMQAGTQNDANTKENGCGHTKRCKCKRKQSQARKMVQMQEICKESKCMHAKRGNYNGEQMHARKMR